MRIVINIAAGLCLLVGIIWILQGVNVIPGSFMTGQTRWAINGSILAIAAVAVLVWANRRQP